MSVPPPGESRSWPTDANTDDARPGDTVPRESAPNGERVPDPDAPDTDPLLAQNPFGGSWGAGGWGASYAATPAPGADGQGMERAASPASAADRFEAPKWGDRPVLGDVELPASPESFTFPSAAPSAGSGNGARTALLGVGALAAFAVIGGLVFWLMNRSPSEPDAESASDATTAVTTAEPTTTPAAVRDPAAEAQLLRTLPAGYPPGACRPVAPDAGGTVAAADCAKNLDPGGPTAATFVVAADRGALDAALTAALRPADIVVCPGNIQSPGPWRRNAKPDQVAGTLVCGMQGNVPTVAWSDFDRQVVSVVRADPPGPGLDQLYQWWASHS